MAQQIINIGTADNDGTGDPARTAFNKTNQNFTELYATGSGAPIGAEYITSTTDATLTAERVLTDTTTVTWDRTTAGQIKANATGSGAGGPPQGRLTLSSTLPVMTSTLASQTTIYYLPYIGNSIPIYDGSNMVMTIFAGLSATTTDTTKSPAAIGASKVNDWFVWNDAGTIRIGHGPDWTSDTARSAGTALLMVNGILLNNAAITNGPAASRGTYVGTTRSNASSQLDWIYGTTDAPPIAAFFGLWNCYNRKQIPTLVAESTVNWTYNVATIRAARGQATFRCNFVRGLDEDVVEATYKCAVNNAAGVNGVIGPGLDTTTAISGLPGWQANASANIATIGMFIGLAGLGLHYISANEYVNASISVTFYGANTNPGIYQGGLYVTLFA